MSRVAMFARGDATRIPLPDRSVDLVIGSPPYCDARTYGIGAQRDASEWVEWMLRVTDDALRVSKGAVIWIAAGVTRDRNYWPACEGLMWEWFKRGGHAYRPCYWHRVGIPGSGGDQWFRADVEYAMCFKREGKLPWSDNVAMGVSPKWEPGGDPTNRLPNGKRVGIAIHCGSANNRKTQIWRQPEKSNPGNLLKSNAGHGHMGTNVAHENEAPYPEKVPEFFVRSLCPEGGIVCDPFSGSGTTVSVAARWDRLGIGFDLRQSQCVLGRKRYAKQRTIFDELWLEEGR